LVLYLAMLNPFMFEAKNPLLDSYNWLNAYVKDSKPVFKHPEYFPNPWLFPIVHTILGILLLILVIVMENRDFKKLIVKSRDN